MRFIISTYRPTFSVTSTCESGLNAHAIAHTRTRVASTASHIGKANDFQLCNGRESVSRFHARILDAAGLRRPQCPTEVRGKTYV